MGGGTVIGLRRACALLTSHRFVPAFVKVGFALLCGPQKGSFTWKRRRPWRLLSKVALSFLEKSISCLTGGAASACQGKETGARNHMPQHCQCRSTVPQHCRSADTHVISLARMALPGDCFSSAFLLMGLLFTCGEGGIKMGPFQIYRFSLAATVVVFSYPGAHDIPHKLWRCSCFDGLFVAVGRRDLIAAIGDGRAVCADEYGQRVKAIIHFIRAHIHAFFPSLIPTSACGLD